MRRPRTSGRVFSRPQFFNDMILVGVSKDRNKALKKIIDRKNNITRSTIIKSKGLFSSYVYYK